MSTDQPLACQPLAHRQVLSPTQLAQATREMLEHGFPLLWLQGEISNFVRARSGHLYFTIKDAGAQIRCALFRPRAILLRFAPGDGQQVLMRARVTFYEPRGDFQLQVEHMEEAGLGALQREFDALKARLEAEGLFAQSLKRPVPARVGRIAVITSPSGAAIHDVLTVLARRFPLVQVDIFPTLVQGKEAAAQVRRALQAADAAACFDVLLVTRGGGSLEDLWAFNDEALARAIRACQSPVVAAIGHEIDFSIADAVADLRAATPSAAAELLVPDQIEVATRLRQLQARLETGWRRQWERGGQRADSAFLRLRAHHPLQRLRLFQQRLDHSQQRLHAALQRPLQNTATTLQTLQARLRRLHPRRYLDAHHSRINELHWRLQASLALDLRGRVERLRGLARTLNVVSPLATLDRGYAIAFDQHGQVLRSVRRLAPGSLLRVQLADGSLQARVTTIEPI